MSTLELWKLLFGTVSGTFLFPKTVRVEESIIESGHLISRSSLYKKVKIFRKSLKLILSTVTNFDNKLKSYPKKFKLFILPLMF